MSLSWGWYRFACIAGPAFHGAMRIGEPLQNSWSRSGIEFLHEDVCFLCVRSPKPGRRGRGKVQHSKVKDKTTVQFAE